MSCQGQQRSRHLCKGNLNKKIKLGKRYQNANSSSGCWGQHTPKRYLFTVSTVSAIKSCVKWRDNPSPNPSPNPTHLTSVLSNWLTNLTKCQDKSKWNCTKSKGNLSWRNFNLLALSSSDAEGSLGKGGSWQEPWRASSKRYEQEA